MEKQVLILNGAGVGGLMQTIPLLAPLHQKWPGKVLIHRKWAERIRLVMELLQGRHDRESAKQLISGLTGSEP